MAPNQKQKEQGNQTVEEQKQAAQNQKPKSYEAHPAGSQEAHKVKPAPPVCEGCWRWPVFQDKCWYYWDGKKYCTMWSSDPNELPPM
ncbi:hypothetical protein HYV81_04680 [Candidatus Woesearchaeota archaeon]|nr:hypothetical protein [Candidatus Woesearchaeota archaeon]